MTSAWQAMNHVVLKLLQRKRSFGQTDKISKQEKRHNRDNIAIDYLPILKPQRIEYNKFKGPE